MERDLRHVPVEGSVMGPASFCARCGCYFEQRLPGVCAAQLLPSDRPKPVAGEFEEPDPTAPVMPLPRPPEPNLEEDPTVVSEKSRKQSRQYSRAQLVGMVGVLRGLVYDFLRSQGAVQHPMSEQDIKDALEDAQEVYKLTGFDASPEDLLPSGASDRTWWEI